MILPINQITSFFKNIRDIQKQPAGVDLTLKAVFEFEDAGKIDFDNSERKISSVKELKFEKEWLFLKQGTYKVSFNEIVSLPNDVLGILLTRTSLLRSGVTLNTGVWDPGYEGRGEAMLYVGNSHGIYLKQNARIGQLFFIKLLDKTYSYKGIYHKKI